MKTEAKEMKKTNDRLSKEKDNLFIARNKETHVLAKQINLHISDIVGIQNSLSNMYFSIGKKEDELMREKEKKKKQMKQCLNLGLLNHIKYHHIIMS